MAISLGSNISSLAAQRELSQATSSLAKSYQRLSSGMRINQASDDAAGLAISSQLIAKSREYTQGIRNLNDGLSLVNITEGAFTALNQVVTRLQELAEQSTNGVYSSTQRGAIDKEAQALSAEYSRITQTTTFNGLSILDGSVNQITLQGGNSTVSLNLGAAGLTSNVVGTGNLQVSATLAGGNTPNGEVIADFNGDGKGDIAAADDFTATLELYFGNGNGTFSAAQTLTTPASHSNGISAGDINGDGITDLVVESGYQFATTYIGNGNGTFKAPVTYQGGLLGAKLADLNGDGIVDLISTTNSNAIDVFLNNGNGTFKAQVQYFTPSGSDFDSAIADFNNDGKLDIATTDGSGGFGAVIFGNGNGTFTAGVLITGSGSLLPSPVAGDLNGDGIADIAVTDYINGKVDVFFSNGNGTFKAVYSFGSGVSNADNAVGLADFNSDGKLDALVTNEGFNSVELFLSNGNGTFLAAKSLNIGIFADTLALGDLNHDGVTDAVVGNFHNPGQVAALITQTQTAGAGGNVAQAIALGTVDLSTQQGAQNAITSLSNVQQTLANANSILGAFQSGVNVFINALTVGSENFQAAAGRIQDVDVAEESANLTREQILQQAGASVLAQANQEPRLALKLLGVA